MTQAISDIQWVHVDLENNIESIGQRNKRLYLKTIIHNF